MQMKDWYRKWTNYKEASGWGQEGNHKTQLAYLRTVVLDEIRTMINFDSLTNVARAIHEIKTYMNMAVIPLTLQRLELLQYKPPLGQSQTVTTQTLVQMFRECEGFAMTPEETLIICMLNTITDKALMVKVNENLTDGMSWMEVRNIIVKLDRAAHLSDVYCQAKRMHANAAQSKSCRACGKSGHM